MDRPEQRLRVLHVIHDFLPRHRAGSEIYAASLCHALLERHHVTVLCAEYDPSRPDGHLRWRVHDDIPVVELASNWICTSFEDTYRSPTITARINEILQMTQPDVVHIHNLLNLSFDLPSAAQAQGIPVVATLHDYTLVCPSGGQRVHRSESYVCHEIDSQRCVRCFTESPFYSQAAIAGAARAVAASSALQRIVGLANRVAPRLLRTIAKVAGEASSLSIRADDIEERLRRARKLFADVNLFVAPSSSIAAEFIQLGVDPSRMRVSDYGFRKLNRRAAGSRTTGPLRVGFVGTLVWHKGVHVLLDAVRLLPVEAYELVIHGDANVFPDYSADLRRRAQALPVRFAGGFTDDAREDVYAGMDVLVVPSLWLENSPLVIHEAFMAGVPVIGARMGGIADLVADGVNGRLYDSRSSSELAAVLRTVIENRSLLSEWERALPPVKSIQDDAAEWDAVYREFAPPRGGTSGLQ